MSIIGPNGAGKTTLLRILALLERPDKGWVRYRGEKVESGEKHRGEITMVFQNPAFFTGTVADNVGYGLKIRGMDKQTIRRKVREALRAVNLAGFEKRKIKALSGGEKQRVALARALCIEPRVLLLDEPTANLDPPNCERIRRVLKRIKKNITVVIASHHLGLAKTVADRVAYIHQGKLLEIGSPEQIFGKPRHRLTKLFVEGKLV